MKSLISTLIISLLFQYNPTTSQNPFIPNKNDLNTLREQLRELMETDTDNTDPTHQSFGQIPSVGSLVRLSFHDCIGPKEGGRPDPDNNDLIERQCNGCIDLDNSAHAGLESLAVEKVEPLYRNGGWQQLGMSRADFYATIGTMALEYAAAQSGSEDPNDRFPPGEGNVATFLFGRTDCSTSPDARLNSEADFPAAEKAWDAFFAFFRDNLGFNLKDATVIMGAHALGRCHKEHSGFEGVWTEHPQIFDHQFWKNVIDPVNDWTQVRAPGNDFFQWEPLDDSQPKIMMLNPDISVQGLLEPHMDNDGRVDCRLDGSTEIGRNGLTLCGDEVSAERGFVDAYANDNTLFLNDFEKAWNKLLVVGWNSGSLVEVIADPHNFEEWFPSDIVIDTRPQTDRPTRSPTDRPTTNTPTTSAPTAADPTSETPTTAAPTTANPTVAVGTPTDPPTTDSPTTDAPTTDSPTTDSPTTAAPTQAEGGAGGDAQRCCRSIREPKVNLNGRCWHHETVNGCETEFNKGQFICNWETDNCLETVFQLTCKARGDECGNHVDCCSDFCRLNAGTCR